MKKLSILLFLLVLASPAYAEKYRAVDDNGSVALVISTGNIEEDWKSHPLYGHKFLDIDSSQLPDPSDRKYWKIAGNSVVIDAAKKQADLDEIAQKQAKQDAALSKLKISRQDYKDLTS